MQQDRRVTVDIISEVGISEDGGLYVRPSSAAFEHIWRAAMEVNWDPERRRLFGPKPRTLTYCQWFTQIVTAAADEYGTQLQLTLQTDWANTPDTVRAEITSAVGT